MSSDATSESSHADDMRLVVHHLIEDVVYGEAVGERKIVSILKLKPPLSKKIPPFRKCTNGRFCW